MVSMELQNGRPDRGAVASIDRLHVIQQTTSYCPDYQPLFCLDSKLVLDTVDGVSDRQRLISPSLSDLSVRLPLREQREYLALPLG